MYVVSFAFIMKLVQSIIYIQMQSFLQMKNLLEENLLRLKLNRGNTSKEKLSGGVHGKLLKTLSYFRMMFNQQMLSREMLEIVGCFRLLPL